MFEGALSNLLIVDSGNGEVYFVEDKNKKSKLPEIAASVNEDETETNGYNMIKRTRRKSRTSSKESEEIEFNIKQEIKDEPPDEEDYEVRDYQPVFVDTFDEAAPQQIKIEPEIKEEPLDENWSDAISYDDFEFHKVKKKKSKTKKKRGRPKAVHHDIKLQTLKCHYCDDKFSSMTDKKFHACKYLECPPGKFICKFCGAIRGRKALNDHIRKKHSTAKNEIKIKSPFECDLCGNKITKYENLKYHMNMHLKIPYAVCTVCGAQCFSPSGWKKHSCFRKSDHPIKTIDSFFCRYCSTRFPSTMEKKTHKCDFQVDRFTKICRICKKNVSKNSFNHHMQTHSQEIFDCPVCGKQFNNKRCLKVHLQQHEATRRYKCDKCTESFVNKSTLEHHKRFHGEKATKSFTCEYCSRTLCSDFSLRGHIQRHHSSTVMCEICKFEAANKQLIKDHIKEVHGTFSCSMCSKTFTLPRYLRAHEKTHFEDKQIRITCPVCFKGLLKVKIKSHVFRLHKEHFNEWQKVNPEY